MSRRLYRRTEGVHDEARLAGVLWRTVLALGLLFGFVLHRYAPGEALPLDAPEERFSGERALALLTTLIGDQTPHPLGSPAQEALGERLQEQIRALGLEPEVQDQEACGAMGTCGRVANILVRLPGSLEEETPSEGAPARRDDLLLVAHYDSTPTSPGANDNLSGVAAGLEVLRALKASGPQRGSLVVLFTDGEEVGLLGAEAFRQEHPWVRSVGTVLNLDTRGAAGRCMLFQIVGEEAWVAERVARSLPSPAASSAYQAVYPYVPADTDFSVFRRLGLHGIDMATVGRTTDYHSERDRLETVSVGTLQEHGEAALELTREILSTPMPPAAGKRAPGRTYFDVLRLTLFHWPAPVNFLLVVLAALALRAVQRDLERRENLETSSLPEELVWLGAAGLGAGTGALLVYHLLAFLGVLPGPWVAYPQPLILVFVLLGVAAHGFTCSRSWRWSPFWETWLATWWGWTLLGLLLAWKVPGLAYLFLVPALLAALGGGLTLALPNVDSYPGQTFVVVLPALVVGVLWFPPMLYLYLVTGFALRVMMSLTTVVILTPLVPLLAVQERTRSLAVGVVSLVLATFLCVGSLLLPVFHPEFPQPLSLVLHQGQDADQARWLAEGVWGPPPWPMRQEAGFQSSPQAAFPWSSPWLPSYVAPLPRDPDLEGPRLEDLEVVTEAGQRRVSGVLRSSRPVQRLGLGISPGHRVLSARLGGRRVPFDAEDQPHLRGGWCFLTWHGPPQDGVPLELVLEGEAKTSVVYYDLSRDLPDAGREILEKRGESATRFQWGEGTLLTRGGEL